jgi:hypothetical protein
LERTKKVSEDIVLIKRILGHDNEVIKMVGVIKTKILEKDTLHFLTLAQLEGKQWQNHNSKLEVIVCVLSSLTSNARCACRDAIRSIVRFVLNVFNDFLRNFIFILCDTSSSTFQLACVAFSYRIDR